MSHRHATPWISGAYVFGGGGLGVLAETIPATGDNGGSFLYPDVSLPADNGKEICGRITNWPSLGTLDVAENGAFTYTPSSSGPDFFEYLLIVDGVASTTNIGYGSGVGHVNLQVGSANAIISVMMANAVFDGNAHQIVKAIFSPTTDSSTFSGGAHSANASSFSLTTADTVFSGNAHQSGVAASVFSPTTADAVFSGGTVVFPKTLILATLTDAVFMGGASAGACAALVSAQTDNARFTGSSSSAGGGFSGSLSDADVARIANAVLQAIASLQPTTISVVVANRDQIAADVWGFTL